MPSMSFIRLTFSGGPLAEVLSLIPQLRTATRCTTQDGSVFFFYQNHVLGGSCVEQHLARLLNEPETYAEIISSDRLMDLLYDAVPVNAALMRHAMSKDEERARSEQSERMADLALLAGAGAKRAEQNPGAGTARPVPGRCTPVGRPRSDALAGNHRGDEQITLPCESK